MKWLQFSGGRVLHLILSDPYLQGPHKALCGKSADTFAIVGTEPLATKYCAECQRRLRTDPARNVGEVRE